MTPGRGHFWPQGHNLNKLVRGPQGDATYQSSRPYGFRKEDFFMFLPIYDYVEDEKIFFSETTRPRALIFGMKHNLVDLYHFFFKLYLYPLGQKWPHSKGHMLYIGLNREKHEKIFLSETIKPRAMIFGM